MDEDELYNTIHGAVRDALAEQRKKNPVLEALYILLAVWLGIAALDYLSHARWVNKFRYAIWYRVDGSRVQQLEDKPPSDCDFLKAPIGFKGCHYKKEVVVEEPSAENGNKRSVTVFWWKENTDN